MTRSLQRWRYDVSFGSTPSKVGWHSAVEDRSSNPPDRRINVISDCCYFLGREAAKRVSCRLPANSFLANHVMGWPGRVELTLNSGRCQTLNRHTLRSQPHLLGHQHRTTGNRIQLLRNIASGYDARWFARQRKSDSTQLSRHLAASETLDRSIPSRRPCSYHIDHL